jgi:hypothetical protein
MIALLSQPSSGVESVGMAAELGSLYGTRMWGAAHCTAAGTVADEAGIADIVAGIAAGDYHTSIPEVRPFWQLFWCA